MYKLSDGYLRPAFGHKTKINEKNWGNDAQHRREFFFPIFQLTAPPLFNVHSVKVKKKKELQIFEPQMGGDFETFV